MGKSSTDSSETVIAGVNDAGETVQKNRQPLKTYRVRQLGVPQGGELQPLEHPALSAL